MLTRDALVMAFNHRKEYLQLPLKLKETTRFKKKVDTSDSDSVFKAWSEHLGQQKVIKENKSKLMRSKKRKLSQEEHSVLTQKSGRKKSNSSSSPASAPVLNSNLPAILPKLSSTKEVEDDMQIGDLYAFFF